MSGLLFRSPRIRDQVDGAAFLLDLNEPESLVTQLLNIMHDQDLVNEKIKKGKLVIQELNEDNYWNSLKKIFDNYAKRMKCWKQI